MGKARLFIGIVGLQPEISRVSGRFVILEVFQDNVGTAVSVMNPWGLGLPEPPKVYGIIASWAIFKSFGRLFLITSEAEAEVQV